MSRRTAVWEQTKRIKEIHVGRASPRDGQQCPVQTRVSEGSCQRPPHGCQVSDCVRGSGLPDPQCGSLPHCSPWTKFGGSPRRGEHRPHFVCPPVQVHAPFPAGFFLELPAPPHPHLLCWCLSGTNLYKVCVQGGAGLPLSPPRFSVLTP